MRDIKMRLSDEKLLESYKNAVDESSIFSITDKRGVIQYANDKFCKISGYSKEELIGAPQNIVRHPDMDSDVFKELWKTILDKKIWKGIVKNRAKNGSSYYVSTTIVPIVEDSVIQGFISIRHDITEVVEAQKKLNFLTIDSLTNLPNRQKLLEDLSLLSEKSMFILIKINQFDDISSIYGEDVVDTIAVECAKSLVNFVSDKEATLYRVNFEIFGILVTEKELWDKYLFMAKNSILVSEEEVYISKEVSIALSFSVGVCYEEENLLRKASIALHKADKENKNIEIYSPAFNIEQKQRENISQLKVFKYALQNDAIVPFFQPIVNAQTGEIKKYEAIARIVDKDGSVISPDKFLDIAKKSNLHDYFTRQIIQKIFRTAENNSDLVFSINLTYNDITNEETLEYIKNRLQTAKSANIVFELLESEEFVDYSKISDFITLVREYDCGVSIDDFGSGYSNFNHLAKLDIDYIKIDGSIIKSILTDANSALVVKIICDFAKEKKIKTIAEFASSKEIVERLKEYNIDFFQGYYFGEPREAKGYNLK